MGRGLSAHNSGPALPTSGHFQKWEAGGLDVRGRWGYWVRSAPEPSKRPDTSSPSHTQLEGLALCSQTRKQTGARALWAEPPPAALAAQMSPASSPGCSFSNPAPCYSKADSSTQAPAPMWEPGKTLLIPGFGWSLVQPRPLWPFWGVNQPVEELPLRVRAGRCSHHCCGTGMCF